MSKHTPGLWSFRRVHCIEGRPATALMLETQAPNQPLNDPCIMAVREDWIDWLLNTPRGRANAALIEASPDLLAACEAVVAAWDGMDSQTLGSAIAEASAAIANAEGKVQHAP